MVSETGESKGIPSGALTILIIAAIAIVSVIVTIFCMLVSRKRTRQCRERQTGRVRLSLRPSESIAIPTFPRTPTSPSPLYITPATYDPKFDAPPTYEEAIRNSPVSPGVMSSQNQVTNTTVTEVNEQSGPARIDVQMEIVDRPSTSSSN